MKRPILWCAHRGIAAGMAAENSREALQLAIGAGVDAVAVDVRHTENGELVLARGERPDGGAASPTRTVKRSFDDIHRPRATTRSAAASPPAPLVSLHEAFSMTKGRILLRIDVRADAGDLVANFVRSHGAYDDTILHFDSSRAAAACACRDRRLRIQTVADSLAGLESLAAETRPSMVELRAAPDAELAAFLRSRGFLLGIDATGKPDALAMRWGLGFLWRKLLRGGCDFVLSDHVVELRAYARDLSISALQV